MGYRHYKVKPIRTSTTGFTMTEILGAQEAIGPADDNLLDINSTNPGKRGRLALTDTVEIIPYTVEQLSEIELQTNRTVNAFREMLETWSTTGGATSKRYTSNEEARDFVFILDFSPQPKNSKPNLVAEAHWEAYKQIRIILGLDGTPPICRGGDPKTSPAIDETYAIPGTELSLAISPVIGGRLEYMRTDNGRVGETIYKIEDLYIGAHIAPPGFASASQS